MPKGFIINFAKNMTKNDIKKFTEKNNIDAKEEDIETVYNHIKKYCDVFFNNPIGYIKMLKGKIDDNVYYEILALYEQYRFYL